MACISVLLAALIGYLAFTVARGDAYDTVCGITSGLCFLSALLPVMGLSLESGRLKANVNILAILFFVVFLVSHFAFAAFGVKMPYYIIINGILLLIYLAVIYKMASIKDV